MIKLESHKFNIQTNLFDCVDLKLTQLAKSDFKFRSVSEARVMAHIRSLHEGKVLPVDRRFVILYLEMSKDVKLFRNHINLDKKWISLVKECFPTRKSVIKSYIEELREKKVGK